MPHVAVGAVGGGVGRVADGRAVRAEPRVADLLGEEVDPVLHLHSRGADERLQVPAVSKAASGTPWKSSSSSGRVDTPSTAGQSDPSIDVLCSHTELIPGNRGGRVTCALSQ